MPEESDSNENVSPEEPDAIQAPSPASIITPGSESKPEPVEEVALNQAKAPKKRRGLKLFICLLVIVLIAAGGAYGYHRHRDNQKKVAASQSKTVQHLSVAISGGDMGDALYPNSEDTDGANLVSAQMFDGLVRYEDQNKLVPDLASGWTNPTDNTWLFTIKSGIKFHDGHTLTPADVKYTLDLVKSQDSTYAQDYASTIQSVDLVGANQVKITTAQPDPALLNKLTFLYIIDQNLPKGDEPSLAGTGAYEIKPGTTPTHTHMEMVAFNGYHGGTVYTKALSIYDVNTVADLLTGFKNHTYDLIGEVPSNQAKPAGSYTYTENDDSVFYLGFNTTTGPLSNKLVRQAIRYAVNPTVVGKAIGEEVTPLSQLIPPSIPGYNPSIMPYTQNIAKAKQLLTQAGYPNGLTLQFTYNDSSGEAKTVINQLEQVGITVTPDYQSDFDNFINKYLDGQGQIFSLGYNSSTLDGADIFQSTLPPANYNNSQFTNLVSKAADTVDPAARLKLLQQAGTIVDQDAAVVPFSYTDHQWLMNKPYVLHQDLPAIYTSVYFYKVHL